MTSKEVLEIFLDWKDNEFAHFRSVVEKRTFWILTTMIGALLGIIGTLVAVLAR